MKYPFECKYTPTPELFINFYIYLYFKRPVFLVFDAVLGLAALINIIVLFAGGSFVIPLVSFSVIFCVYLILFLLCFIGIKISIKNATDKTTGQLQTFRIFIAKKMIVSIQQDGRRTEIPVSKITDAVITHHSVYIISGFASFIVIPDTSHITVTSDRFIDYLLNRGIEPRYVPFIDKKPGSKSTGGNNDNGGNGDAVNNDTEASDILMEKPDNSAGISDISEGKSD